MNETIAVKDLTVNYTAANALSDINFELTTGKMIGIIGPNGAGKSTLMKAMLGLIKYATGEIKFSGQPLKNRRKQITYVKQKVDQDLNFPIQVKDVVMMGLYHEMGLFKLAKKGHKEKVKAALTQVDMLPFENRQISELSGGQLQRVFIARVIAQDADYIFLDEPFTGVDVESEEKIMATLKDLQAKGKTILMVHHDLSKVRDYFDEVVLINKELIAYGKVADVFTKANVAMAFKNPLMELFKEDNE